MNSQIELSIAGLSLRLQGDRSVSIEDRFRPFLQQTQAPDIRIEICQVAQLPPCAEKKLWQEQTYRVYEDGRGILHRAFIDPLGLPQPYATGSYDYPGGDIRIAYLEREGKTFSRLQGIFHHVGIESLLLYRERMCFHAACVQTDRGGILFSGPSGIGKSTQAELWCRHRGARLLNGDRPILGSGPSGYLAWGSPYAGSSRCYVNASCPVNAIVMLCQGQACALRRLSPGEAFRAVWSGVTVPGWDARGTQIACDLALGISAEVPCYELTCTPDEQAVLLLEQELRKDGVL